MGSNVRPTEVNRPSTGVLDICIIRRNIDSFSSVSSIPLDRIGRCKCTDCPCIIRGLKIEFAKIYKPLIHLSNYNIINTYTILFVCFIHMILPYKITFCVFVFSFDMELPHIVNIRYFITHTTRTADLTERLKFR